MKSLKVIGNKKVVAILLLAGLVVLMEFNIKDDLAATIKKMKSKKA